MPLQRNARSPRYSNNSIVNADTYSNNKSILIGNQKKMSFDNHNNKKVFVDSPRSNNSAVNDINEIRKLIREQTNLSLNNVQTLRQRSNSNSSDDYDLPLRRFTPIPPIPRADDAYFRTESKLIKDELLIDDDDEGENNHEDNNNNTITPPTPVENSYNRKEDNSSNIFINNEETSTNKFYNSYIKKETKYHFGGNTGPVSNRITNYNYAYRLPSLDTTKQINHHSLQNTMDLDEDLPVNPVNFGNELDKNMVGQNQRLIYTSPGDRSIISPVKRPQAPSPLASSYRRKPNQNKSESDSDSDFL